MVKRHEAFNSQARDDGAWASQSVLVDIKHSAQEKRLYWVGRIFTGRVLTTRFTKRGNKIRIIGSAEWRRFRRLYHETTKCSPLEN